MNAADSIMFSSDSISNTGKVFDNCKAKQLNFVEYDMITAGKKTTSQCVLQFFVKSFAGQAAQFWKYKLRLVSLRVWYSSQLRSYSNCTAHAHLGR